MRALEFLLGDVRPGDTVLTLGGEGSTHVLATATHAARLGARTLAVRWPHDMSPMAHRVVRPYQPHGPEEPLMLQNHNTKVRYRNVWIRRIELPA